MEAVKRKLDFVKLYEHFQSLKERISGLEAEIKRVASPEALVEIPSFYRLMEGTGTHKGWQRVVFFMPYVKHKEGADSIGQQLARGGVSEMRLFQIIRSGFPNDIIQLRRLVQQVKPTVDWQRFGKTLYYWDYDDRNNRQLLEDYFLASKK